MSSKFTTKHIYKLIISHRYTSYSKYVNQAKGGKTNFEEYFRSNHIETSSVQKLLLGIGSGIMSITDPRRGDMVAVLGESTGGPAFHYIRSKMKQSEEGRQILEEKPRISSSSVNLEKLKEMPEGTLGKSYSNFLEKYGYTPDERLAVRFVDDIELAYVAQRYREVHDLFHTILNMPTNMLGEVTVKWVEAIQTKLPMCTTAALCGPFRLAPKLNRTYSTKVVPILDADVAENMRKKNIKPKNHPGKRVRKHICLPEDVEASIISYLNSVSALKNYNDAMKHVNTLYSHKSPAEGLKKLEILVNYRNYVQRKLSSKGWKEEKLMEALNNRVSAFEKSLTETQTKSFGTKDCWIYLMARAPFEYAVLYCIFSEIKLRDPDFKPKTIFDFGSGIGTVTWAASTMWEDNIKEYFTVDVSKQMNEIAYAIIEANGKAPLVQGFVQRQFMPSSVVDFDIVVSAFTFSYLNNFEDRMQKLNLLWNKTCNYLVIVENGTKDGFRLINEARDMLLRQSVTLGFFCHVVAPCPHDYTCPRAAVADLKPCKFFAGYRELKLLKEEKYRKLPYSYAIFKKEKRCRDDKQYPRVVSEVLLRNRHTVCDMCCSDGKITRFFISAAKCGEESFKCSRKLCLGDCFPGEIKSVNTHDALDKGDDESVSGDIS